jgi:hypothetical protein
MTAKPTARNPSGRTSGPGEGPSPSDNCCSLGTRRA